MAITNDLLLTELLQQRLVKMKSFCVDKTIANFTHQYELHKRVNNLLKSVQQLVDTLGSSKKLRVLDLGCGDGFNSFNLYYNLKNANIVIDGVDFIEMDIYIANKTKEYLQIDNDKIVFSIGDACDLKLSPELFDIVVFSEVIEHLPEPEKSIREISKVLKKGGFLVLSTPNAHNPVVDVAQKLKEVLGKVERKKSAVGWQGKYPGHISTMSVAQLKELVTRNGFRTVNLKRGSILYGSNNLDRHPVISALIIIFDRILDHLPFTRSITENITMVLAKE